MLRNPRGYQPFKSWGHDHPNYEDSLLKLHGNLVKCSANKITTTQLFFNGFVVFITFHLKLSSKEQSPPWEAYSRSARQDIPCLLLNVKVHYHIHESPP
jgi:hypothetical protein